MGRGSTEWSVGCRPNGQSLICHCVVLGAGQLHEPIERKRQAKLPPNRCRPSPSGLSSSRGECTQVALGDSPRRGSQWQTSFNGEVRESSWPMGPRARWHITAALCAAIPRMRHSGVGKVCLWSERGGLGVIASPNAGGAVGGFGTVCANSWSGHSVF